MHLCLVSEEFLSEIPLGGIGTYTRQLSRLLESNGHQATVVTFSKYFFKQSKNSASVIILRRVNVPKISYLIRSFQTAIEIVRLNKRKRITVVELPEWGALGFFYTLLRKIFKTLPPLVVRLHTPLMLSRVYNGETLNIFDILRDKFEYFSVRFSDLITCPTKVLATIIKRNWNITKEIIIVPNFIDANFLNNACSNDSSELRKSILFIGNLGVIKGVNVLLKALPLVFQEVDAECHILGRISSNLDLNERIKQAHENSPRIKYLGFITGQTKLDEIIKCDVVVIPSLWENFPMVCLETMALSKIVVASKVGGLAEIITDNVNGFFVTPGNYEELADVIKKVLRLHVKEKARIQTNARKTIQMRYISSTVGKTLFNLYLSVANNNT